MISIKLTRAFATLLVGVSLWAFAAPSFATSILYLNSTRGAGTGNIGNNRQAIADALDSFGGGSVFDVTFVQTHVAGDLASNLGSNPNFDQIWFDTTILDTNVLSAADLAALNAWAAVDQPEFILDSSYFFRNTSGAIRTSAQAVTVNEALALRDTGSRGILIGTDHDRFTATANAVLENFGFDELFTGLFNISPNAQFVGDLLLIPEAVDRTDFFNNHLQSLSTSDVPIGTHQLNANGANREIEIFENLFSLSPDRVAHIGASFDTGQNQVPVVPAPATTLLFAVGVTALAMVRRRRRLPEQQ